jgi:Tfp pilus assembly protein PilF
MRQLVTRGAATVAVIGGQPAKRALALREKALGPTHPDVASSLASLYQDQGAHNKAEPLYIRALAIRETALGSAIPMLRSA